MNTLRAISALTAMILPANCTLADSEHVRILPRVIRLDPSIPQRIVVERMDGTIGVSDLTGTSEIDIVDSRIAGITPDGRISSKSAGTTLLRAKVDGRVVEATIIASDPNASEEWSFRNRVLPVLTRAGCNQGACHGAAAGKNGFRLTLRGYGPEIDHQALTRQALGRRIDLQSPEKSLLLLKATGTLPHGGGMRFSPDSLEYQILSEWIAAGAPGPASSDPRIARIEVLPAAVRLRKDERQKLIVLAHYGDGRSTDVTPWAKFATADEGVAKVDDSGAIQGAGPGETTISVWFSSMVAAVTVTSPYLRPIDPSRFASAPRRNRIDELNLEKLQALGIPPSPDAGDSAFLRRAFLDATGRLPTIEEVERFLADADPEKRSKLIDRLIGSEAFVDYWAYKWSDLFLVSSNKLPPPAMWSFYRFLRRAVEENRPWDEICRSVITAKGSTLADGAANYFVLHRDPIDLTENASMAFLGLSMTCARCHDHPMEKWTQDQYYGLANLFARVRIKDGPTAGDSVVLSSPDGDIPHPRTGAILEPRPLDGDSIPVASRRDRRELFADWLVSPENPYFARAIVNRVWRNFFSRGLVEPEDDLRATNPASDERLLAWLIDDFRKHDHDVAHLIRTIMNSALYARSSSPVDGNEVDLVFGSRYVPERLPAEVLLDAMAQVTRVPTSFSGYPAGWRSLQLPDSKTASGFLDTFGRPERENTCSCERSSEPSMSQALHLANGSTLNEKLRDPRGAPALEIEAGFDDAKIVDRLFKAALSRPPSESERKRLTVVLAESVVGAADAKAARRQAIEDLYWATLTGKAFLFNH
ncbi:MAG: DUF1549 and DUF1553 domain-containing protein [Isosphaeraceae bacterium]|nr:DUF1549 and DUF1553 domain-containing protein [Isosphaeraceae bacterium]